MATCWDNPKLVWSAPVCVLPVSKNVAGDLAKPKRREQKCERQKCDTLHTIGQLTAAIRRNPTCDSKRARLLDGRFVVHDFATAYDIDAQHRGVHAGNFVWTGHGLEIHGRMSGITNAGILRNPVFDPASERCSEPGSMIGRLCGQVTTTEDALIVNANLVAVYRFLIEEPATAGTAGRFRGTLEGALIPPC